MGMKDFGLVLIWLWAAKTIFSMREASFMLGLKEESKIFSWGRSFKATVSTVPPEALEIFARKSAFNLSAIACLRIA